MDVNIEKKMKNNKDINYEICILFFLLINIDYFYIGFVLGLFIYIWSDFFIKKYIDWKLFIKIV